MKMTSTAVHVVAVSLVLCAIFDHADSVVGGRIKIGRRKGGGSSGVQSGHVYSNQDKYLQPNPELLANEYRRWKDPKEWGCEMKPRLRDKWYFIGQNRNTFMRIRRSAIQFREDRNNNVRYRCVENTDSIYLLRMQNYSSTADAILCVGFTYIADNPFSEYNILRLMSPGVRSHIMSPKLVPINTTVTIENSCDLLRSNRRRPHNLIKRRKPGCKFGSKLKGIWNYTYRHARHLEVTQRNMTLELLNGTRYVFTCDTRDRHHYVIRIVGYDEGRKDAVMCLRITPLDDNPFYSFMLSRTNSGTDLDYKLRVVARGERVYLHTDCDYLDSPSRPEFIYPM